jgi:nucleoid-associated protein YgaU
MKLPKLFTRKKLRATTARRALGAAEMEYEEMSEPNMKLSRALLIVLVLHVVAVAGIIAFNTIKTRQGPRSSASTIVEAKVPPIPSVKAEGPTVITSTREEPAVAKAPAKPVVKEERKSDQAKPAETKAVKADSSKTYVVAKGDNPVSIAKKLKVPYSDFIAVNNIDDPHKLKIGQKLIIPAKTTKPKKGD